MRDLHNASKMLTNGTGLLKQVFFYYHSAISNQHFLQKSQMFLTTQWTNDSLVTITSSQAKRICYFCIEELLYKPCVM